MATGATSEAKVKAKAGTRPMPSTRNISHNLNGQRLGRKGRDTRDRILAVAREIIEEPNDTQITLSEVARRADLRMGSLYLYFSDLTELILALLEPVMATSEEEYLYLLRRYWPDAELGARALEFVTAYQKFWIKHSDLLHLRNSLSDRYDERLLLHRVASAQNIMRLLVEQMDGGDSNAGNPISSMATALMTGLERVVTVTTDRHLPHLSISKGPINPRPMLLEAEARLFELGIRDRRAAAAVST